MGMLDAHAPSGPLFITDGVKIRQYIKFTSWQARRLTRSPICEPQTHPFLSPRCPLPSRAAGSDEAGPSTAHEPRKRSLFQEAAREADFQEDFPVFSEVAEALRAAASGTVVGAPDDYSDAFDP